MSLPDHWFGMALLTTETLLRVWPVREGAAGGREREELEGETT